jgi:hypothetical protein
MVIGTSLDSTWFLMKRGRSSNLFSQSKRPLELAHIFKSVVFGKDGKGINLTRPLKKMQASEFFPLLYHIVIFFRTHLAPDTVSKWMTKKLKDDIYNTERIVALALRTSNFPFQRHPNCWCRPPNCWGKLHEPKQNGVKIGGRINAVLTYLEHL